MSDLPFDSEPLPKHIAIIMDGNGRWAKERGKARLFGHKAGAESVRTAVRACGEWGIDYLTLYAFSTENWKRPKAEVGGLMKLLEYFLSKEVRELNKNNVRLETVGDVSLLPAFAIKALNKAKKKLADNDGLTLVLALNYGSRDEITRGVKKIAERVAAGELAPDAITEEDISSSLDSAGMPDPDLMIRTAGEVRLSNFLLWQLSYAELYSTDICWPDFGRDELAEAIKNYQGRTRKFGSVVEK